MDRARRVAISERESEVLSAIGEHLSNAQIAHRLHISVRTVESHVSSLLRKYGVTSRRELVTHAAEATARVSAGPILGIPSSPTSFVGREQERDAVLTAMDEPGLVTVTGPGGMGKTRLAALVASAAAVSFPGGGAFVDLVPVRNGLVAHAVADALGVLERPPTPLVRTLLDRLSAGRSLLVLDNCEQLVDEVAALVARLLAGCPSLSVLATSRERLALPGERIIQLPPLPLASDAERLFMHRARAVDPEFDADPAAVSQLCADLDGMPLAIELAASRAGSLGVDGLRTALEDRLRLLAGGRHHDPRHRSMRAVIGWSYELLDVDERSLFRRVAIFEGGFDLDAAVAVSADMSRSTVADLVGRLTDKSLIVHHRRTTSRWRMPEILRAFARDELARAGELDDAVRRRLGWAAQTAAGLEDRIEGDWRWEFDDVIDDLRAASASTGPVPDPTAHRLARSLAHLTFAKQSFVEAREHYRAAANRAGVPGAAVAELRRAAATAVAVSDGAAAFQLLLDAAALAGSAGANELRAVTLAEALIVTRRFSSGFASHVPRERTSVLLQQAAAAADPSDLRAAAVLAAARAWERGADEVDPDLARVALDAARRVGEPRLVAAALDALGVATTRTGRMREAHRIATDRLRIVESLPPHEPLAAVEVVDAHYTAAVYALCAGDLPAALAVGQRPGVTAPIAEHPYLGLQSAQALALTGRFPEAIVRATTMWEDWRRDGSPVREWLSPHAAAAALAHGMQGDLTQFERWRARACELARVDDPAQSRYLAAFSAFVDARVAVHVGRLADAARLVDRAFADFRRRWWEGYARVASAELAVTAALPEAPDRLAAAARYSPDNDWAAACLARAHGRLDGDPAATAAAAVGFERIGARAERACTLVLLPDRADEARAELRRLGCTFNEPRRGDPPAGPGQ